MTLDRNIPSFIKIEDKKIRVWYPGQDFSCARCYRSHNHCLGKGRADECERQGGEKANFDYWWDQYMHRMGPPRRLRMHDDSGYNTDMIMVSRAPENMTVAGMREWLMEEGDLELDETMFQPEDVEKGTWTIKNIGKEHTRFVQERLESIKHKGKRVIADPVRFIESPEHNYGVQRINLNQNQGNGESSGEDSGEGEEREEKEPEKEKGEGDGERRWSREKEKGGGEG